LGTSSATETRERVLGERLAVALVAGAYAAVSGFLVWRLPLWVDEIYTLHTTAEGPVEAARRALSFELQPPVYFVLEALWRALCSGPLAARVPSTVFGAATVVVGAALAHRLIPGIRARWAALLIATNPFVIWAGSEARCYALVMLLGATICLVFVRVHLEGWSRGRPLLVALAILSLYTQYYLGFVLVAAGGLLLLLRRYREALWYVLEMGVVLVLFLPQIGNMLQQTRSYPSGFTAQPLSIESFLFGTETDIAGLSLPVQWFWGNADAWTRVLRWGLRLAVGAGIARVFWRGQERQGHYSSLALLALLTVVPYLTGWMLTRAVGVAWLPRYWAGFAVPALLLPVALACQFGPRVTAGALIVLVGGNLIASGVEQGPLAKTEDNRRVARTLERLERDDEPILVTPADRVLSLRFYYGGRNRLIPIPREPSFETYRWEDVYLTSTDVLREALHSAGDPKAAWILTGDIELRRLVGESLAGQWHEDLDLRFAGETSLTHFVRGAPSP
jgi:hypothetical protein